MLIISYVSNAGPACGSRYAEQVFPPPDRSRPRQCSRSRIPNDARAQALIYPQIDIKKSGKTHLIEDVVKTAANRYGLANRTISLLQIST
jgi:hypothetical protein